MSKLQDLLTYYEYNVLPTVKEGKRVQIKLSTSFADDLDIAKLIVDDKFLGCPVEIIPDMSTEILS